MNKICKEYISDAKKFFPIMGKDERNYLRGLNGQLEEFCEEKNISSKHELFEQYCQPYNIANDYYESVDTEKIIKKIKISKYVKALIAVLITVILVVTSVYITFSVYRQIQFYREEIVDSTEMAANDEEQKYTIYDYIKSDDFIEDDEISEEEIIDDDIIEEEIIE